MLLSKKEVLAIINKIGMEKENHVSDVEIIEVLRYYIHLRKGKEVQIQRPTTPQRCIIMDNCYKAAVNWMEHTGHLKEEGAAA